MAFWKKKIDLRKECLSHFESRKFNNSVFYWNKHVLGRGELHSQEFAAEEARGHKRLFQSFIGEEDQLVKELHRFVERGVVSKKLAREALLGVHFRIIRMLNDPELLLRSLTASKNQSFPKREVADFIMRVSALVRGPGGELELLKHAPHVFGRVVSSVQDGRKHLALEVVKGNWLVVARDLGPA